MTDRQTNYLRMIIANRTVMEINENPAIWDGNAWVVTAKANIKTITDRILLNAGITEADLMGTTETKETLWFETATLGVHMNTGVKAWAQNQTPENTTLVGEMHYTMSDLHSGAVQDALTRMSFIAGKLDLVPVLDLPNVNITSDQITLYSTKISSLTDAVPLFRAQQVVKAAATSDIVADFILLRTAKGKQNTLINTYKISQNTFWKAYEASNTVINLGKGAKTAKAVMAPNEHVAWFHNKFLPGYTVVIRNHSLLASIKVFLSDSTDVPAIGGFEIGPELEFKLAIPKDFGGVFGHYLIIVNLSGLDNAKVTGILAKGVSASGAPEPPL